MTTTWTEQSTYLQGGVIYAVQEIREYLLANPNCSIAEAAATRATVSISIPASDYGAAARMLQRDTPLAKSSALQVKMIAREVLEHIIIAEMPPWAQMIPWGRRPLRSRTEKTESNVYQCFDYGDLFADDHDVLEWWARMEHHVRDVWQQENNEVGLEAERLSLSYEIERLKNAGRPDLLPYWESREDTRLGYDIQSWDETNDPARKIYIETKGCRKRPLAFHLSENQWKVATSKRLTWRLHLWDLSDPTKPFVLSMAEIEPHIPENQGSGKWTASRIAWPPKGQNGSATIGAST